MFAQKLIYSGFLTLAYLGGCSSDPSAPSAHGGASSGGASSNGGSSVGGTAGTSPALTSGTSAGGASAGGSGNASGASGAGGAPSTAGTGGVAAQAGGSAGTGGGASNTLGVRIVGRTAPGSNNAVRFSWPGVTINARFTGTQVSMNVNDGNNKNRFSVVVDGGAPTTVTTTSGQTALPLATGLPSGTHDLVIWRNTEASIGVTEFSGLTGFGTGGALLAPPAAPTRRLEVIGDSLSVGAGVLATSTDCSADGIDAFTNNYQAYGSVAARAVQADVVTIAWSGIGVYRNYAGSDPTMPKRYDYSIPNDDTAWDFSMYQPDAVIINLGTNDFSQTYDPINPGQPYVDAYVGFVQHIRTKYATAPMILIDMYGGDRLVAINNVITALNAAGEKKVAALSFSGVPNNNTACGGHPNTAAQKAMGDLLTARLKTLLGW